MTNYTVKEKSELFDYLRTNLTNFSKNNIKNLLKNGNIYVNNIIVTKHNFILNEGDVITIGKIIKDINFNLKIIYEDDNIIVVDKKTKLLTISNEHEKEETLYRKVSNYLKTKKQKVFVIHRLDYDTSGVIMFAKKQKIQELYQKNWNNLAKKREYTAVVEGITKDSGHIESYLKQTKTLLVYSSKNKDGYFSITDYKKIKSNNNYSLLKIYISTGRRNQIRCHMHDINHPIAGDTRYNSKTNPINRLCLHASTLKIINPLTNKLMIFTSEIPKEFNELFKCQNR